MPEQPAVRVYLEIGAKRTFAAAIEWPGWCRSGRGPEEALGTLVAYGPRYATAIATAAPFLAPTDPATLDIVERLKGGSGTDFGAPSSAPTGDAEPVAEVELERLRAMLAACWATFDRAAASATGVELRRGPRGGGRDLAKIVAHVREAEEAYLVQLGSRPPKAGPVDVAAGIERHRGPILDALSARARGGAIAEASRARTPWPPRYFVRRAAWHLLDHAWELEDRSTGARG